MILLAVPMYVCFLLSLRIAGGCFRAQIGIRHQGYIGAGIWFVCRN